MSQVKWNDGPAKALARKTAMAAAIDVAEDIGTASMDEAPVLSGTMRRSEAVTPSPARMKVYISYNTPYAVRQHEELEYNHTDGKAKYLEDPLNRKRKSGIRYIQRKVNEALQKGR